MNEQIIVGLAKDALRAGLYVAGPALIMSLVVGLIISIFQVVTSLQDQTLAFVPKIIAVLLVVVISFPWMVKVMVEFTTRMFTDFNTVVRQIQ